MVKENISLTQLFMLIFNFLLGSAIVIGVGKDAKQDAWIAIILMTLIGIGLMYFYYSINRLLPSKNLFEIMEYCFTRPIAILLSLVYVIYFLYTTTRVIRTFGEMITTAILPNTPIEIITLSIMLVIAYIIYLGLEVLARVAEIFTPYIVLFLILVLIFLLTSGEIQLHNIEPVLGDGMKPILKAMFPTLLVFPFGELVVFTIILSSVTRIEKKQKSRLYSCVDCWYFPCCLFFINGLHIRSGCLSIFKLPVIKYDKIDSNCPFFRKNWISLLSLL